MTHAGFDSVTIDRLAAHSWASHHPGSDPAAFVRLSPVEQDANRDHVAFIPILLGALGYQIVPASSATSVQVTEEEVEAGARLEHLRWARATRRAGRTDHPDLRPFDELPTSVQELDRVRVRMLPTLLGQVASAIAVKQD
jgi:hypothetical protein